MSQSLESDLRSLKIIEEHFRCAKYQSTPGEYLSKRNQRFMADLYTIMAGIWFDVSHFPNLLNKRWVSALCDEPILGVAELFKWVDSALIQQTYHSYADFKHQLSLQYPKSGQILAPLKGNLQYWFQYEGDIKGLRTALRFTTRANLPDPIGLEREAFEKWAEVALIEPPVVDTTEEEKVLAEIFPRSKSMVQVPNFVGRFGPGACAWSLDHSLQTKYSNFCYNNAMLYAARKCNLPPIDMPRFYENKTSELLTSEIHFAPKQLDKMRTVSKEPASLMFYQLGIFRYMCDRFAHSRWARHIDLEHAELNQQLAYTGAMTGEYATIDLSEASDRVRLSHVKQMFRGTSLREALICFRSRYAWYEGTPSEFYTPTYFAPMGSGLCFPTMCACLAATVDVIMRRRGDRRAWHVYGDDIVVPCAIADELMERLVQFGHKPNYDKSFCDPNKGFRESCGADYMWGYDVHPVYISRMWTGLPCPSKEGKVSATAIESNVALANSLAAFKHARVLVIRKLLRFKPGLMFDMDGTKGISTKNPTNYHLKKRWNTDLQREEYYHGTVAVKPAADDEKFDDIRLFEWLRTAECNKDRMIELHASIAPPNHPYFTGVWGCPAPGWNPG